MRAKARAISQQRIALDLGVSQALVSLVLNGKRENISAESYERIWNYALKRGYRPKGMQPNGNHVQPRNVGFILRAGVRLYSQSNFFSHVQHGLHAALQSQAYGALFLGSEDDLKLPALQDRLLSEKLLGLVVMGEVQEPFLRQLRKMHGNIVSISASYPGLCNSVMPNDPQSLELLVDHLNSLGHEKFAWIGGNRGLKQNQIRRSSLIAALKQKGLALDDDLAIDVAAGDRTDGFHAAEQILKASRKKPPTAWLCLNGLMARGVLRFLAEQGVRVPHDISVAAVDATRVCVEEHPQITGANADPEKMGAKAADLLLSALSHSEGLTDVIMPSQLTVRETTAQLTDNYPNSVE